MALPKVTPGRYNYGSYANPKQVKLADTSAIGTGLEKIAAGAGKALDIKRKKEEQIEKEQRAEARVERQADRAQERRKEFAEFQSDINIESYEKRLDIAQEKKDEIAERDLNRRAEVINLNSRKKLATITTAENLKIMDEELANIDLDESLNDDQRYSKKMIFINERNESMSAIKNMQSFQSEQLESVAYSSLLTEDARILKGIQEAKNADAITFNGIDAAAGGTFTIPYINKDGKPDDIVLSATEINNYLSNADKYVEIKQPVGSSKEDQQVIGQVLNIFKEAELREDELYYDTKSDGTKVLNKEAFKEQMMQNPLLLNQAAAVGKNAFRTMTGGQDYDPNNSKHNEMVLREYVDVALRSLESTNPSLFKMPEKETGGFKFPPNYNSLSDAKQKNILKRGLESEVKAGNISIIQDYFGEEFKVEDGKYFLQDTEVSPARLIENYIEAAGNTWQASTENLLRQKPEPTKKEQIEGGLPIIQN